MGIAEVPESKDIWPPAGRAGFQPAILTGTMPVLPAPGLFEDRTQPSFPYWSPFLRIGRAWKRLEAAGIQWHNLVKQYWYNPSGHSTPVFMLGCGRSGTTMLLRHLGRSWQVDIFNENHPAAFSQWRIRSLERIGTLVTESRAPVVVFKPILNTCQGRTFLEKFPDARILFIFRHYNDVINSSMKRFGVENRLRHVRDWVERDFDEFQVPPPEETKRLIRELWSSDTDHATGGALYWLFYNRLYFDLRLNEEERVLLLCYETMVGDPEAAFRRICQHCQLKYQELLAKGVHEKSVGRAEPPEIAPRIRQACDELWDLLCNEANAQAQQFAEVVKQDAATKY